jgi:osmotically-inducible protein OsmY
VPDRELVRVVVRQLDADPQVSLEHVRVVADRGIVVLEGVVPTRLVRSRAVSAVGVVRGVRGVVDRLVVVPPEISDTTLELAIAAAIARDVAVPSQVHIDAHVSGGVVRLSGSVDMDVERRLIEEDVAGVPGVRTVLDNVAVSPVPRRSRKDRSILHQVERLVSEDPWLDRSAVRVAVGGGIVHLEGKVRSAPERARAESDTRMVSPAGVDATGLAIADGPDDGTLRAAPPGAHSDAEIQASITDACARDPRVRGFIPEVNVRNGIVVLTGVAPDAPALAATLDDAANVPGAMSVHDALKTGPLVAPADERALRAAVTDAVHSDPSLSGAAVAVDAVGGRVILHGVVPNDTARVSALARASSVVGVSRVEDALIVEPPRLP